jgi:hypothetical protein
MQRFRGDPGLPGFLGGVHHAHSTYADQIVDQVGGVDEVDGEHAATDKQAACRRFTVSTSIISAKGGARSIAIRTGRALALQ